MIDSMPAVLWAVAVMWAVAVCVICVARSKILVSGRPHVDLVSWRIIGAQLVSAVLAAMPFAVFKVYQDAISSGLRSFYISMAWPAGIVVVLLVALELVLMYVQAKRAMRTQMDETLAR